MAKGPYELPKGWRWVKLGEVCEINPRRPRLVRDDNAPTSFVPMTAVDEVTGTITNLRTRPFAEVKSGYRYFQEETCSLPKSLPVWKTGKQLLLGA